jgi:uncharacterized protein GlcG (DUF336 family)
MKVPVLIWLCLTLALTPLSAAESEAPPPADKPPPPASPLPVSLPVLIEAGQAALATCKAAGWPVGLTVVDADLRDAGAGSGSVEVSHRKAYTAAKMGMSSEDYALTLAADDIIFPAAVAGSQRRGEPSVRNADPMLLPKAGGLLIRVDGKIVGAMGVSGRPAGGDVECVKAGLARIATAAR